MKMEPIASNAVQTDTARQKELFEDIHEKYYESSDDAVARAFKEEYTYSKIQEYVGQSGSVIELACGMGAMVGWLKHRQPHLRIAGCDISERAAEDFRKLHDGPCYVADLTKPFSIDETFDTVIVMGGIHHLVADLDTAFANIRALLNPGGRLIMTEPNADYFLEPLRKLWYALDKSNFDAANEHALSHGKLFREHGQGYELVGASYFGGIAYHLLVLNYFLRIPNSLKMRMAPFLMWVERVFHKLPGKYPFASFVACWQVR